MTAIGYNAGQYNNAAIKVVNILAIETSASACSVALSVNGKISFRHKIMPMQQAASVLPFVDELLREAGLSPQALDAIAVGQGPGSFTGIRIAVSVAQGLAFALNVPVVPVSSLAILALTAHQQHGWQKILTAVDARMHEVYWGGFEVSAGQVKPLISEGIFLPAAVPVPETGGWYGVGSGWQLYRDSFPVQAVQTDADCLPQAAALIELASHILAGQGGMAPADVHPVYLRDSVAKKSL